jgi:hypothetical protein
LCSAKCSCWKSISYHLHGCRFSCKYPDTLKPNGLHERRIVLPVFFPPLHHAHSDSSHFEPNLPASHVHYFFFCLG